jgi:hypothetical protein
MGADKEVSFPVDDFLGVDRQVDREDISQYHVYAAQNLWEKFIGVLETRGHSQSFAGSFPSKVVGLGKNFRVYKSHGDHRRVVPVHITDPDYGQELTSATDGLGGGEGYANLSMAFVSDVNGYFLSTIDANRETRPTRIILRLVGYGYDKHCAALLSAITGWSAVNGNYRLDVTVSSAFADTNITGIEVLAYLPTSHPAEGTQRYSSLHIGFIDLVTSPTGTFSFYGCPVVRSSAAADNLESGELNRAFTVAGNTYVGGTLIPGKKYYITVMSQHYAYGSAISERLSWRQYNATWTSLGPYVLNEGENAFDVFISAPLDVTYSHAIAIGEHPRLLKMYKTFNIPSAIIFSLPVNTPCVVDFNHVSASNATHIYKAADFSHFDMFSRIADDGTKHPCFLTRYSHFNMQENILLPAVADASGSPLADMYWSVAYLAYERSMQNKWRFVQAGNVAFGVNGARPEMPDGNGPTVTQKTHNYHITDGTVVALTKLDYTGTPVDPPEFDYIAKHQDSIVCAGGTKDSRTRVYFTQASEYFDFEASLGVLNYFEVAENGEPISGLGLYTNTSASSSPESHLLITKQNSLYIIKRLPLGSTADPLYTLSAKVGCVGGDTIVNTPVGTIITAVDNIYLVRESGEPVPVGDPISIVLKGGDLTRAQAVYHDEQYKLSLYHSDHTGDSDYNNVEWWLDIKKMKQLKGQPNWSGPMIGRAVDYSFVEDLSGDGASYNTGSTRYAVDVENIRLYKVDVAPAAADTQILDFATAVTSLLETKDYQIAEEDKNWNKLLTRFYWKIRTNKLVGSPLSATEVTWVEGIQQESKTVSFYAEASAGFDSQPQKVTASFPQGRYRGRTVRKRLSTTDRVGIGGFAVFYKIERRRI